MIELYEHNQTAYESAVSMLARTGRAAIIHPTGTGKSFIGFKLCEDNPDKTVCWLSPSEYIFRTQLENLRASITCADLAANNRMAASSRHALKECPDFCILEANIEIEKTNEDCKTDDCAGKISEIQSIDEVYQLENIRFLTYAKLMRMSADEMADLKPDMVVLDEFHRAGASRWGAAVQDFLNLYPNVPVLGLSATNIRYLDGQRDMADELFDGHIASEMTLGDAIVRGILNPPKYVLSLYSCQKELERYRERTKNAKNSAVRAEAEKYLEALRRALEKADGLDEIFYRYMTEETIQHGEGGESAQQIRVCDELIRSADRRGSQYGKYLVFCANYDHMQEMIAKVPEWFHKVDQKPHIYSVYSEDAQAQEEFARFKADDSRHLKLLFCIDMLNEGIHVDDVSGVILLRPTISPIIYKQQIGRALSAGKKKDAVIFDVVMNIENLYSIGTVEEEMQAAVQYYRERGEDGHIVNEHFRVIDELRDCMQLFRKLNETLGASWDVMYRAAERYFEEHGNLEVTKRYVTEEGYSLGQWLDTQRKVRAGKVKGVLSDEQIDRLDRLGLRWESKADQNWERHFAAAQEYYRTHGNLLVNVRDGTYGGVELGKWLAQLRTYKKSGIHRGALTPERIRALEDIGMVWDVPDYLWEQNFHAAVQYHREHGDLDVPSGYVDENGVRLGAWIANLRCGAANRNSRRAELSDVQVARLNELGMVWDNKNNTAWERSYDALCRYRKEHGDINVPRSYVTEDGYCLGRWFYRQRKACHRDISEDRRRKLERLGI